MAKKKSRITSGQILRFAAFGAMCAIGSFAIGIQTAGDVHPFSQSEAAIEHMPMMQQSATKGDVNRNGVLDLQDAIAILEYAEGMETPTEDILPVADVDGDYRVTAQDALRVMRAVANR